MIRLILFPFSLLYGFVMLIRNKLFDWGLLKSVSFDIPTISLGNLSTGGTGKTPHVEYLIRLLEKNYKIATLSRGYKRKTRGYVLAEEFSTFEDIGDESVLYKNKYKNLMVAVDESRVHGIERLLKEPNPPDVVILDDAFQHRSIKPGLSILLSDYNDLYCRDYVVPTGSLREFRSGANRADIIVVTKSPHQLTPELQKAIIKKLHPDKNKQLFFSSVSYGDVFAVPGVDPLPVCTFSNVILFAGIANSNPFELYLKEQYSELNKIIFPDHHEYSVSDIDKIIAAFNDIQAENKIIITTEKDMVRLLKPEIINKIKHLPFAYIPIKVNIHKEGRDKFNRLILDYVKQN